MSTMSRPNFVALRDLHNSANDLLHSPIIQQSLVHHQQEKWVHEVSETSLRMVDVCGTTKDVLLLVKDHLQDLRSTFRRISAGDETAVENKFGDFHLHRKTLKKEMLKRLKSLKGMKKKKNNNNKCVITTAAASDLLPVDQNLMVVVKVLTEVRVTTMSIVESLMSLLSLPNIPNGKSKKGSFALRLKRVDSLSLWEKCDARMLQTANKRLEAVEIAIEDLEMELECMFRRLIQTRVSLLNILTN